MVKDNIFNDILEFKKFFKNRIDPLTRLNVAMSYIYDALCLMITYFKNHF